MTSTNQDDTEDKDGIREAVGVFHQAKAFEAAIAELYAAGFARANIGLLASESTVEQKLGHKFNRVEKLEDDQAVPRAAYIEPASIVQAEAAAIGGFAYIGALAAVGMIVASGGSVGVALIAAALGGGTGGAIGSVVAGLIGKHHSDHIERQLKKGGLLLWVSLRDPEHEQRAIKILKKFDADHVHVHTVRHENVPADNPLSGFTIDPFLPGAKV